MPSPDPAAGRTFLALYAEEALRGETVRYRARWLFLLLALFMVCFMLAVDRYRPVAYTSLVFLVIAAAYNYLLGRRLRRSPLPAWLRYLPTSMDIFLVTIFNYLVSVYGAHLSVATSAIIFVYPIILLFVALRLDKGLLIYAIALTLFCFNLAYFLRYPHMDPALVRQVVSADITGQVFKSIFLLGLGLSLLFIHRTIRRLVEEQAAMFQERQATEERHLATLEAQVAQRTQELSQANQELRQALAEVKALSGLLPICSHCKKIRDDQGYWQALEKYIAAHSQASFSHGVCPECLMEHYPEYSDIILAETPAPDKKG
ncbi:MAG: hypothetical protein HY794_18820 [Desulfarculus sp.]|nr:hypothetical protein [Desulfarculus sp.]